MAQVTESRVPVQRRDDDHDRRRGFPLWAWPLIPLLLGALALGLSLTRDDDRAVDTAPNTQGATNNAGQGTTGNAGQGTTGNAGQGTTDNAGQAAGLTDMLVVVNDQNQQQYAGQTASFSNVTVQSVVGDRGFWVGPSAEQQLFVVIDEANVGQAEGQIQVQPGQNLTLSGVIEQLPPLDQAPAEWGLDASNSAALANQQVYLHARQVVANQ